MVRATTREYLRAYTQVVAMTSRVRVAVINQRGGEAMAGMAHTGAGECCAQETPAPDEAMPIHAQAVPAAW